MLDRMAKAGWGGLDTSASSDSSPAPHSGKYGSIDSGYAESVEDDKGGWHLGVQKLKQAVSWGGDSLTVDDGGREGARTPVMLREIEEAGSHMWDRLTSRLQTLKVAAPWTEEEDDEVGQDGVTRLWRAIRE